MNMVRNLFQRVDGKSILFIFFLTFACIWHIIITKGSDYRDKRAITDRLKFAIRILEGAVEGQESVDDLIVAKQLISEAIYKLKACNNQKN